MISQHRHDVRAIFSCEHCSDEELLAACDDGSDNLRLNVIPNMKCKKCGKTTLDKIHQKPDRRRSTGTSNQAA